MVSNNNDMASMCICRSFARPQMTRMSLTRVKSTLDGLRVSFYSTFLVHLRSSVDDITFDEIPFPRSSTFYLAVLSRSFLHS